MLARVSTFVAIFAATTPAVAAPITSLYSTGLGPVCDPDPHYTLISKPTGSTYTGAYVVNQNNSFPFDAYWAKNGPTGAPASGWIAPTADVNTTHAAGQYTYRTTFDLTGFDPSSAQIKGFIAADNGVDILLNGNKVKTFYQPTGYTFTPSAFASQSLSINSGFIAGMNTLDFVVTNEVQATGNPTGLRAALSGTANPAPTPEPATAAVLAGGLVGLAGYIRRRRSVG
jgi:hypothetical protein